MCLPYYPPDPAIRFPPGCVVYDEHTPPTVLMADNRLSQYRFAFTSTVGSKTQHIQVFEVPADQRVPPRQYVQTQIDQAMKGCECPLPRALRVNTFSCRRCPALPFCPTDPSCRYPPGPVIFYDATPPPCLDIHSQADVFSISFVPTPNGLVQHIQLRTGIPIGMKRAQYEPPYTPRVAPLYLRETPFPSALLPADGEWVDPRSNEGCGATWLQSCVELYDASDDVSIDF